MNVILPNFHRKYMILVYFCYEFGNYINNTWQKAKRKYWLWMTTAE